MRVCRDSSRIVVLIGRFAVKVPNVREYRLFPPPLYERLYGDRKCCTAVIPFLSTDGVA